MRTGLHRRAPAWRLICGIALGSGAAVALAIAALRESELPSTKRDVAVEVEGCGKLDGPVCIRPPVGPRAQCEPSLPKRPDDGDGFRMHLTVRMDDDPGGETLRLNGEPPLRVTSGVARWDFTVSPATETVELEDEHGVLHRIVLEDAPAEPPPIAAARRALADGGDAEALEQLVAALPDLGTELLGTALDLATDLEFRLASSASRKLSLDLTRRAYDRAREQGEPDRGACHARRAIADAAGRVDLGAGVEWQRRLHALDGVSPRSRARASYVDGQLYRLLGDYGRARAAFEEARAAAAETGDTRLQAAVLGQLAELASAHGREDDFERSIAELQKLEHHLGCIDWIITRNDEAWARFGLADMGRPSGDPVPILTGALEVASRVHDPEDACQNPLVRAHLQLNLALAAAQQGWWGWADALGRDLDIALDQNAAAQSPAMEAWRTELDYRIALGTDDRGALAELLLRPPEPPPTVDVAWSASHTRAHSLERLGLTSDALAEYARADETSAAIARLVDFDEGRDRLLLSRQPSAQRRVALLLAEGQTERALCIARRARSRSSHWVDRVAHVAALSDDARQQWSEALDAYRHARENVDELTASRWSLPKSELPAHDQRIATAMDSRDEAARQAQRILGVPLEPDIDCTDLRVPSDGTLGLLFFPKPGEGWFGFAFDDTSVTAASIESAEPLESALLQPFAHRIRGAKALRMLPTGTLWNAAFANAQVDGETLNELPVTSSLDLQARPPRPRSRKALVVGDTRGDLPFARAEAESVADALERHGLATVDLVGSSATREAWVREMSGAGLLHYAGHGELAEFEGWGSTIKLAGSSQADVASILALESVPSIVVLTACDTAAPGLPGLGGAMNVARAFILAGADLVIAARGELDDRAAQRLAEAIYEKGPLDASNGAERLRDALLKVPEARGLIFALTP